MKFRVNHDYWKKQLEKIDKDKFEVKEKHDGFIGTNVTIVRQEIIRLLVENGVSYDEMILSQLIEKFKYTPLCDIKPHHILKEYYKIEDLSKFLTVRRVK